MEAKMIWGGAKLQAQSADRQPVPHQVSSGKRDLIQNPGARALNSACTTSRTSAGINALWHSSRRTHHISWSIQPHPSARVGHAPMEITATETANRVQIGKASLLDKEELWSNFLHRLQERALAITTSRIMTKLLKQRLPWLSNRR